ncbi:MAG TPA: FkbM family methyltransferase [Gammaproteobacteria bacterium]|nr:FkbM family methyltransferase [Gammaproteobacteria bacterium]
MSKNIRALLDSLGVRRRKSAANRGVRQLLLGLERFRVDLVLDVGANVGQFAREIRAFGFARRIVSFEPLSDAHRRLIEAAAGDKDWQVHPRCALGDRDGEIAINVSANSVSSSLLPMTGAHVGAAGTSAYVGRETVPLCRLDTVADAYLAAARHPFLKIDTQGFEWLVLDGAAQSLPRLCGVLCELSLVELYEGQHLWRDVIERLELGGLTLWNIQPGFADPRDGRTLQVDAVFFRA